VQDNCVALAVDNECTNDAFMRQRCRAACGLSAPPPNVSRLLHHDTDFQPRLASVAAISKEVGVQPTPAATSAAATGAGLDTAGAHSAASQPPSLSSMVKWCARLLLPVRGSCSLFG
jgi:hypothetical protein